MFDHFFLNFWATIGQKLVMTCRYYSIQLFLDRTAPYLSGDPAFGRTSGRTFGRRACRQRRGKKTRGVRGAAPPSQFFFEKTKNRKNEKHAIC